MDDIAGSYRLPVQEEVDEVFLMQLIVSACENL